MPENTLYIVIGMLLGILITAFVPIVSYIFIIVLLVKDIYEILYKKGRISLPDFLQKLVDFFNKIRFIREGDHKAFSFTVSGMSVLLILQNLNLSPIIDWEILLFIIFTILALIDGIIDWWADILDKRNQ